MDHKCLHSEDIGAFKATLSRVAKELDGNGQTGLIKRFYAMEADYIESKNDLNKLATAFSALAKADSNKEAIKIAIASGLKRFCGFVALGATLLGVIYLILDHI